MNNTIDGKFIAKKREERREKREETYFGGTRVNH
jgi:hypothetical protein